ncbi:MAG: prepilin-type N-terminal cleavage/methylation domain-containing protein [Muribaculaceae bacterium]|nr:prepilin-type N-terminal cleavage/methylation domain-containing protein [Muribaculaceae bacterium]
MQLKLYKNDDINTLSLGEGRVRVRHAFTLAEILITLGIIGIVAAMTIPNLIANTRAQQYRSKFKKTISTLSQAARMSQAQYGFDYAGITQVCSVKGGSEHPDNKMSVCAILNGTLKGYTYFNSATNIPMSKGERYSVESPFIKNTVTSMSILSNAHAYVLSDGTIVAFSPNLEKTFAAFKLGKLLLTHIVAIIWMPAQASLMSMA